MRRTCAILTAVAAVSVAAPGCTWFEKKKAPGDLPPVAGRDPKRLDDRPAQAFVAFMNKQSALVTTVRYDDVNLKASVPGQPVIPLRSGIMVCEKPRSFRMQAGLAFGGDQIDIGSNRDEMWLFVKQPKPNFVYCSHADFPRVQSELPVPFEPDWVLQALGMTTYDPAQAYRIEKDDPNWVYRLILDEVTPAGQRVRRVTEFAGDESVGTAPQVKRYLIQQAERSGGYTTVASAEIMRVQKMTAAEPATGKPVGVLVPTHVVLDWPVQKVKMDLTLGKVKLNQGEQPALFAKPASLDHTPPVNLADRVPAYPSRYTRGGTP